MVTEHGTLQRAWAQPAFLPFLCETQKQAQEHSGLLISGEVRARRRFTGATGCWAELELFRLEKRRQSNLQTCNTAAAKWKGIICS